MNQDKKLLRLIHGKLFLCSLALTLLCVYVFLKIPLVTLDPRSQPLDKFLFIVLFIFVSFILIEALKNTLKDRFLYYLAKNTILIPSAKQESIARYERVSYWVFAVFIVTLYLVFLARLFACNFFF